MAWDDDLDVTSCRYCTLAACDPRCPNYEWQYDFAPGSLSHTAEAFEDYNSYHDLVIDFTPIDEGRE